MAWTRYDFFIAFLLVTFGTTSTLFSKWADNTKSINSVGENVPFQHPFVQSASMFLGQLLCIIAFKTYSCVKTKRAADDENHLIEQQPFNPLVFVSPTVMDLLATSASYIGLNLTYASSAQMLRGAVIIFTGLMSILILRRRLKWFQWVGMFTVIAGLVIVGVSDFLSQNDSDNYSTNNIIIGDIIVVCGEFFSSIQVVLEEKYIEKYNVDPMLAVGWEGVFGVAILAILMFPMYFIYVGDPFSNSPRGVLEDALDAFTQMGNSEIVTGALVGALLSVAVLNFAGMSVTKSMGSLTRMVLDTMRTVSIWIVSLLLGWQLFSYIQLIGFSVLVVGMCLYNDVVVMPVIRRYCMPNQVD